MGTISKNSLLWMEINYLIHVSEVDTHPAERGRKIALQTGSARKWYYHERLIHMRIMDDDGSLIGTLYWWQILTICDTSAVLFG